VVKRNFVVVAHDERVREALAGDLRARGYSVTRATSAKQAEQIVRSVAVDAVVVESHLPDMPPEELRMRINKARPRCRVVVLTDFEQVRNTSEQLRHGGNEFLLRAAEVLDLVEAPFAAAKNGDGSSFAARGNDALIQALDVVVGLVELDERHFGGFSHQAMRLAREVAEGLSADIETVKEIVIAALLRDLGKAGVETDVLEEKGWYSTEQRERMKTHVDGSLQLFEHIDFPWKVLPIVRHHHERYDGNGYPDGLRGREIPFGSRIVAVVDAYVALTSGRDHRGPFDSEQALTMMVVEAGRQFDPEVVEAFQKVLDKRKLAVRAGAKPEILIVAAQGEHRKVIKMRLVNEGFEIHETKSYKRAIQQVRKQPRDLILVDLDADETAAFRMLQELREDETLCRIPLAFFSRNGDRILKIRALREGVDDFLSKGNDLEELIARVQNILAREATRREGKVQRARRGITGDLENLGFAEIVQILSMGMKTACVTLKSNGCKGQLWFENGAARHAEADGIDGESAFYEMVRWNDGTFVIEHGVRTKRSSLKHDAMYLVMEGLRLMDELRNNRPAATSSNS
jgi:response regulator RpfG family c-di-GMP phosphodiesterase